MRGSSLYHSGMEDLEKRLGEAAGCRIALAGFPFDENSSFLKGTSEAPPAIRAALHSESTNLWTESGIDLAAGQIFDAGDLDKLPFPECFEQTAETVSMLIDHGLDLIALGGDHSITWPIMTSLHRKYDNLNILHFDAHPDLYDELGGSRESHACPFARVMEEGLASRIVQVGIRTANAHQMEQAERFHIETIPMKGFNVLERLVFEAPLYISFDVDALDPAFAPGVSHYEPGGLSVRDVIDMVQNVSAPAVIGADIVEYNPSRDHEQMTAYVCAKVLKEIAARILAGGGENHP